MSYSQAADGAMAPRLQAALHAFAKPWYQLRAIRIFRDKTSLSVSPQLWGSVERALLQSEFLVLLASPQAAASAWVRKELETFVAKFSAQKVLIVLTDGDLTWNGVAQDFDWPRTNAFPRFESPLFPHEPLWVDLRKLRRADDVSLRNPDFRDAVASLSAALRDLPADQLIGEDVRQHQRTMRVVRLAMAVFGLLLLALVAAGLFTYQKQGEALASQRQALESKTQALASAAEALAAAARTEAEMTVSWVASLEEKAPLTAALVFSELDQDQRPDRALPLARKLANELPLAILVGAHPLLSDDGSRVLTLGDDGKARVTAVAALRSTVTLTSEGYVLDAALSSDGRRIVTATENGLVELWELRETPALLSKVSGYAPTFGVTTKRTSVSIGPDGSVFAFLSGLTAVVVRSDGSSVALHGHTDAVVSVAISSNGKYAVTTSLDRSTRVWRIADGSSVAVHRIARSHPVSAEFSADDSRLITQADNGDLRVWHALQEAAPIELGTLDYYAIGAHLARDGRSAVSGTKEGAVLYWDLRRSTRPTVLRGHSDRVEMVALGHHGQLASASFDGTVRTWGGREWMGSTVKVGDEPLYAIGFSAQHGRIFASGLSGATSVWSVSGDGGEATILRAHTGQVRTAAFSHDGRLLATGGEDQVVRLWEVASTQQRAAFRPDSETVSSVEFSPDDKQVLSAGWAGDAHLWDVGTGREVRSFSCPRDGPHGAHFSHDGRRVVTNCGNAIVWDLRTGARTLLGDPEQAVRQASFSRDGSRVLAASQDTVRLWNADGTGQPREYAREPRFPIAASFSPDGRRFVSNSGSSAEVWQLQSNAAPVQIGATLRPDVAQFSPDGTNVLIHAAGSAYLWPADGSGEPMKFERVWSVVPSHFSRDGQSIVNVSGANRARDALVWSTTRPGPPLVLSGHDALINAVDLHPVRSLVVTASSDGTVRLWSTDWTTLRDFVQRRVRELGACLTASQRAKFLGEDPARATGNAKACEAKSNAYSVAATAEGSGI